LLGLSLVAGAEPPAAAPVTPAPAQPRPMGGAPAVAARPSAPLDEPLRLIARARAAYAGVRDYSCLLVKRERIGGRLTPDHVVVMRARNKPFSVSLLWQEPRSLAGQEVCYVAGANGGMMRVKPTGLLSAFGFVSLDPDDARARENSRHRITEAGIGNLIERFARGWEAERSAGLSQVLLGTYEYNKRRCTRVEVIHPSNPGGRFLHYRDVVYFDKETHLPIRMEAYDWPRRPGDPGELVEVFSFVNLRLNVGLPDEVFRR
jgi:hypothetical protein